MKGPNLMVMGHDYKCHVCHRDLKHNELVYGISGINLFVCQNCQDGELALQLRDVEHLPYAPAFEGVPVSELRGRMLTAWRNYMLDTGWHPTTRLALTKGEGTCKSCVHLVPGPSTRDPWACGLMGGGAPVRLRWVGCALHIEREEDTDEEA